MTRKSSEIPLGRPFGEDQFFSFVELASEQPWFLAQTKFRKVGDEYGERTFLFSKAEELEALVSEVCESIRIQNIMFVYPSSCNESSEWKMRKLIELGVASVKGRPGSECYVNHFSDNTHFIDGGEVDISLLDSYRCVFQTKVATDSRRSLPPIPRESCH